MGIPCVIVNIGGSALCGANDNHTARRLSKSPRAAGMRFISVK